MNGVDATPSEEEMAAYLGASEDSDPKGSEKKDSDATLPSLEEAAALIPAKAKALMEELFRARPDRVKRIDPKEIR